jgi:ATP-binding cassette subfamily B protein
MAGWPAPPRADKGAQVMALREHFLALFGVAVALGVFSARRASTW